VRFSQLVLRNLRRSPLRASMTVMTVAIMLSAFIFPRSLVETQKEQIRQAPNNRLITRSRSGWSGQLPLGYAERMRELPGVRHVCASRWAGFRVPGRDEFLNSRGVEAEPFLAMHYELEAPPEQKRAFLEDERSVFVSEAAALDFGWKLGDRVIFESRDYPGTWEVTVAGIYRSEREAFAERMVWLHYDHLNRALPAEVQDRAGLIYTEIAEPNQGGRVARAIDEAFAATPFPSSSLEDKVQAQANIGSFRAVLTALDLISYLILAVVMSILGNTLAMNVRERTHEYGVMRAIGFSPRALGLLVLGEAALLGLLGAAIGLAISYPLFENVVNRAMREAMNFPPVEIPARVAWLALGLGAGLSLLAAAVPVRRLGKLQVSQALRRVN
jgi:putative ABC transport system permease protein